MTVNVGDTGSALGAPGAGAGSPRRAPFTPATPAARTRAAVAPPPPARVIPVGGGKGGVGKTFLVANLGAILARNGYQVVAVDGDLEGANLHTCLGVPAPPCSLADFAAGREDDLENLLLETKIPNLRFIAATRGNLATPQPSYAGRVRLMRALRQIRADVVLFDLGAGTHPAVMDYFMIGENGIVVVVPEPTSVENAYSFIRAAFYRRLRLAMASHDVRKVVTLAMDERNARGIRTPLDLLREIQALDPAEGRSFVRTMRAFRPQLVVNEVRTAEDIRLGFAMGSVCRKVYGIDAAYLGYVNHDEAARRSVRARQPLVDSSPRCDAAVYLERVARKLVEETRGSGEPGPGRRTWADGRREPR